MPLPLLVLPFLLGLLSAAVLQASPGWNPVYALKFRIDLGTLLLLLGTGLSLGSISAFLIKRRWQQQHGHKLDQVKQEMASNRRRFLRQLDHELKNPLTALRMELSYLLSENQVTADQKVFGDMNTQLERLSRLVTDLRKLAQLEEQEIQQSSMVLGEVLQEVLEAASDHANFPDRQVTLTLLQHPLPLSSISGDRGLLWLACYNLLENALKFSPPGARIEVRAFEIRPWVVLEVADDGPGIPEADLALIFDELYRGENARGLPGSGLGLALVRTIVTLHGGDISVRSQARQGTVFTMRLPIAGT
jgi:two-component system OmpR family sensor kinase